MEYEVLPAVLDMEQAMAPGAPVIHDEPDSTGIHDAQAQHRRRTSCKEIGNVEEGFREADLRHRARIPHATASSTATMEPHVTISWLDADGRLVIRTSTQVPFHCAPPGGDDPADSR